MKIHCPKCDEVRWRTRIKRKAWQCRGCGYLRGFPAETLTPTVESTLKPKLEPKPLKWYQKIFKKYVAGNL